jgi:ankyrin repeat protein
VRSFAWLAGLAVLSVAGRTALATEDSRVAAAVKRQDTHAVQTLVAARADVNGREPDGATALHWAAHWNDLETTTLLIRSGADVNASNDFGVTPLLLACANGSVQVAQALLDAGANPNAAPATGETPLMTAAFTGNAALVDALLARGADVQSAEGSRGQTALMWAVSEKHDAVVSTLIRNGADLAARTNGGFTPLLFAARVNNLDAISRLLEAGADVNEASADGATALLVATVRGHVSAARFLLDRGADPNAVGPGFTPLHWASGSWETELTGPRGIALDREDDWKGLRGLGTVKLDLVKALLSYGADPNARLVKPPPRVGFTVFRQNLAGATPFFLAAMSADAPVMRVLAAAGADPTLGTMDRMTPLMAAAGVGRVLAESRSTDTSTFEAVAAAWELGGDVNAMNAAGETALHGAAHIRSDAVVRFLAEKGATLDVRNRRGETPLMIAERTIAAGSAPVFVRTSTGDLLRKLGAHNEPKRGGLNP